VEMLDNVVVTDNNSIVNVNPTLNLDISLIPLVHDYLNGASLDQCAVKFNMPAIQVSEFLDRKEVKRYISNQLVNSGYTAKKRRLDLLTRIVDQKIELAEDAEIPLSNKDLLEVLKALREEENDIRRTNSDTEEDSGRQTYINIINQLKSD